MAAASPSSPSYDEIDDDDPMEGIPIPEHVLKPTGKEGGDSPSIDSSNVEREIHPSSTGDSPQTSTEGIKIPDSSDGQLNDFKEINSSSTGVSPHTSAEVVGKSLNTEGPLNHSKEINSSSTGDSPNTSTEGVKTSENTSGLTNRFKGVFGLKKDSSNLSQKASSVETSNETGKFFSFFKLNSKLKTQLDNKHNEFIEEEKSLNKEFKQPQKVDKITVDLYADNPDKFLTRLTAGSGLYKRGCSKPVTPFDFDKTPKPENYTRFVCVSDTHNAHEKIILPPGDVLLHCGDFTMAGGMKEVDKFNEWLGKVPFEHKIVIAGNHELSFDTELMEKVKLAKEKNNHVKFARYLFPIVEKDWRTVRSRLTNCTYLEDSEVTINGIRIWGSPWQPEFGGYGFNLPRGEELLEKWNKIPGDDIDVVMTHGPPAGHSDRVIRGQQHVGCVDLLNTIQLRVQPKYHIFGHIHEDYGITTDCFTTYVNCASVNYYYQPKHRPVVFDLPNKIDL